MHDDLKDLLCAWYVSRLDEGQEYVSPVVCPIIRFSLTKTLFSGIRYPSSSWHASHYDATAAGVHRAPESVEQAMLEGILLWVH
jgi:hypothetical protein